MSASILRRMAAFPPRRRILALFLLVDETWAFAEARAAARPLTPAYYAGLAMLFYVNWVASSVLGALAGSVIRDPRAYGFDFAFTAIFIGLVVGFRRRDGFGATVAASALAATAVHLVHPGPLSIVAGTLAGIAAAAIVPRPERTDAANGETPS
jgi:predicted branched-subunit amino acid permease